MTILAFLPHELTSIVTHALGAMHRVIPAMSWGDLFRQARAVSAGVIIIDPSMDGTRSMSCVTRLHQLCPEVPIVAYSRPMETSILSSRNWTAAGVAELIFHGFDESTARLAHALLRVTTPQGATLGILHRLGLGGAISIPRVYHVLADIFQDPRPFGTVPEIARVAHMSRRTLDRKIDHLTGVSTLDVLDAARLMQIFEARASRKEMVRIGRNFGYAGSRRLNAHAREFGLPELDVWRTYTPEQFITQLAAGLEEIRKYRRRKRLEAARLRRSTEPDTTILMGASP